MIFLPALALLSCRLSIITHSSIPNKLDQHHFRVLKIVKSNPFPLPPQSGGSSWLGAESAWRPVWWQEWIPPLYHSVWLSKWVEEPHFLWLGWRWWSQNQLLEEALVCKNNMETAGYSKEQWGGDKKKILGEKKASLITRVLITRVQHLAAGCQFLLSATHFMMSSGKALWIPAPEGFGHFMSLHTSVSLL